MTLDTARAKTACWIVGQLGGKRDARKLATVLKSDQRDLWMQSAVAISMCGGTSVLKDLEEVTKHSHCAAQREAAAYALSFLHNAMPENVSRLTGVFLDLLENDKSPAVRAQACEGLGNLLSLADRRLTLVRNGIKSLIAALDSPSPEIRFWAAFALGSLSSRTALPALKGIVHDRNQVQGWRTVGEGAEDAITKIKKGTWPERSRHTYKR
ncbi:HEAT repeat domain-containing protein [Candidatus Hydrogenedentota bacterium]